MKLCSYADGVTSREEFVDFVRALARQARSGADGWENRDLPSFLEALAAWAEDSRYHAAVGEGPTTKTNWRAAAQLLEAARVYE